MQWQFTLTSENSFWNFHSSQKNHSFDAAKKRTKIEIERTKKQKETKTEKEQIVRKRRNRKNKETKTENEIERKK